MKFFRFRKQRQRHHSYQEHDDDDGDDDNANADNAAVVADARAAAADAISPIYPTSCRNQQTDWDDYRSLQASSSGSSSSSSCSSGSGNNAGGGGSSSSSNNRLPDHVGAFPSLEFAWNDEKVVMAVDDDVLGGVSAAAAIQLNLQDGTVRTSISPQQPLDWLDIEAAAAATTTTTTTLNVQPDDTLQAQAQQQMSAEQQQQQLAVEQLAPEHRRLMGAWLSKRQHLFGLHSSSNAQANDGMSSGPIDVDQVWDDDMAVQAPAAASSSSSKVRDADAVVACRHSSYPNDDHDDDEEDDMMTAATRQDDKSFVSTATSDQTPVMNNHDIMSMYDHVERSRRSNSTTGHSSEEEIWMISSSNDDAGVFRYLRTKTGKVVCVLLGLLLVAVATAMIGSAVGVHHKQQDENASSSNGNDNSNTAAQDDDNNNNNSPMEDALPGTTTTRPTLSPTQIPTILTFEEDANVVASTASPTQSPTTSPTQSLTMTLTPTSLPTSAPTTSQPTTTVPTTAPTTNTLELATALPSTTAPSTLKPTTTAPSTALPTTTAPTTLHPTISSSPTTQLPTTQPTTAIPTLSPSTTHAPSSQPTGLPTLPLPTTSPTLTLESLTFQLSSVWNGQTLQDGFGSAVRLSADGRVLVVGAPNAAVRQADGSMRQVGSVTIYEKTLMESQKQSTWRQRALLTGEGEQDTFGSAVAINHDGSIVAVSEPTHSGAGDKAGRVLVYRYNWLLQIYEPVGNLLGPARSAHLGVDLALDGSGTRLAVGAPYHSSGQNRMHGAVYVYGLSSSSGVNNEWTLIGEPLHGSGTLDWFGSAVDFSHDGFTVVASAPRSPATRGYVRAFRWNDASRSWIRLGQDISNDQGNRLATDRFGHSLSLATQRQHDTLRIAIGTPFKDHVDGTAHAGMTLVYKLDSVSKEWTLLGGPITADDHGSGDNFGYSVQFGHGGLLAIGAPGANSLSSGTVHMYRYLESMNDWQKHPFEIEGASYADQFGFAVALSKQNGASLAVGARQPAEGAGYATIFVS